LSAFGWRTPLQRLKKVHEFLSPEGISASFIESVMDTVKTGDWHQWCEINQKVASLSFLSTKGAS